MLDTLILLLLLMLSGLFSGSETALTTLSRARVKGLVKEGRPGAHALQRLKSDPSQMLTTILIGNNLVNIGASALATVLATELFGSAGPGIAVGVLTLLVLIFGEITPKSLATRHPERISLAVAVPLLGLMRLLFPLVWLFGKFTTWLHTVSGESGDPTVTESELINMAGYGEQEGTIAQAEREIIERVFGFDDLSVRDVMTPRGQVFSLSGKTTVSEALLKVAESPYSRIPLYDKDENDLHRILHLRNLLEAAGRGRMEDRLEDIAHEPLYVPQFQQVDELFAQLRQKKQPFAVVVDEFGHVRGIVTLEDLVEELVGEIYDESDLDPSGVHRISEHQIEVEGATELRVVEETFGLELPGKPTDTVSYWLLNLTHRIPITDETFDLDGLKVRIVSANNRRIERVAISQRSKKMGSE